MLLLKYCCSIHSSDGISFKKDVNRWDMHRNPWTEAGDFDKDMHRKVNARSWPQSWLHMGARIDLNAVYMSLISRVMSKRIFENSSCCHAFILWRRSLVLVGSYLVVITFVLFLRSTMICSDRIDSIQVLSYVKQHNIYFPSVADTLHDAVLHRCSSCPMVIKIKYHFGGYDFADDCMVCLIFTLLFISIVSICLNSHFTESCRSIFFPKRPNDTFFTDKPHREVPYDQCRCSLLSNKTDRSIQCITDTEVILADVLPVVSYTIQLYVFYVFFSFEGKHSHILNILCWLGSLVVLAIIQMNTRDRSCPNQCF